MFYVAGNYAPLDEVRPLAVGGFSQQGDPVLHDSTSDLEDVDRPVDEDFASSRFLVSVLVSFAPGLLHEKSGPADAQLPFDDSSLLGSPGSARSRPGFTESSGVQFVIPCFWFGSCSGWGRH